ncbi:hypothetical protein ACFXG4_14225 [Nocardia sp. NPDC059246]|uniref:hypothetical protein n=1 Tax=unclassified Nocardia TaxID=2637762 RepID=UPI003695D6D3
MQRDEHSAVNIGGDVTMTGSALAGRDAHVVQAGPGAAVTVASDPAAIRRALLDLAEQIRSGETDLPDRDDIADTVDRAATEVAQERPNRTYLAGLMQAVGRAVETVGSLARAVTAIQGAIDGLFG